MGNPFNPPRRMLMCDSPDSPDSIHGTARRPAAADTASDHPVIPMPRDRDCLGRGVGGSGQHRLGGVASIEGPSRGCNQGEHGSPPVCQLVDAWVVWLARVNDTAHDLGPTHRPFRPRNPVLASWIPYRRWRSGHAVGGPSQLSRELPRLSQCHSPPGSRDPAGLGRIPSLPPARRRRRRRPRGRHGAIGPNGSGSAVVRHR